MHVVRISRVLGAAAFLFLGGSSAFGGSHLWRFNEIFSNADGTIQFIELRECCGSDSETALTNKWISSDATDAMYVFPEDLPTPTGNRHLLIATAGFADLPAAPEPDFIMPDSFFSLTADTLRYWTYTAATMTYGAGDLPADGVTSLNVDLSSGTNSPTNFAGESGSVDASGPAPIPAASVWGLAVLALALLTAGTFRLQRRFPRLRTETA